MGKRLKWGLTAGFLMIIGFKGPSSSTAQTNPEHSPVLMIYVRNYAGLEPDALSEAEDVARSIYQKAGVETRWAEIVLPKQAGLSNSNVQIPFTKADIQLNILPREMSVRYGLPENVTGLAPGSGPDRNMILLFADRIEALYLGLIKAYRTGDFDAHVSKGQILGYMIAHELGHILLNMEEHTAHGMMCGKWSFAEFREISQGLLLFTSDQAELIRRNASQRSTTPAILTSK